MTDIQTLLGSEAESLLSYRCSGIDSAALHLPGEDYVPRIMSDMDRSPVVLRNMQSLLDHGRLGGTGYLSILPVDQGVEHSGAASFAPNPIYFDPAAIVELALEGGCNAVASTLGVLGAVARKYAHRLPFIVKLNHNEQLTYPSMYDQTLFASVRQAFDMGAVAVGATIYFGAENSRRQIEEVSEAFSHAHELGLVTILWAYLRNSAFKTEQGDFHTAADLTGQANHLAATIGADIVKQKQAERNGGYTALKFGHTHPRVYSELAPEHPIEWVRYQVANCYMGRIGLINSGGPSGSDDLHQAVRTAVINKRAGGMGLISGRKSFQKPMGEGVALLNAIQDVYLNSDVTIA
ncbi:class I fructose-bisphosphate aldolase [Exilibacterium tricleocarpae]|uniref:fructose-bisphosphate aldolase n=1 Tax=Exilibacterium tricleocarpae TaxID=2591008 RepID=A0A545TVL1_9GAMM|nr:class I fructose-bisphosphate aldolase [Exilibacterium tricleocarpae]TQV81259.1 class I fructose-bisphosphate aldolase [Exilibacterium tricleocarpae]